MEIIEVLEQINNLDIREALRKFGPQWAIVMVNKELQVEKIKRFKYQPTIQEARNFVDSFPDCVYFYTNPGMFESKQKLEAKIKKCREAFLTQQ